MEAGGWGVGWLLGWRCGVTALLPTAKPRLCLCLSLMCPPRSVSASLSYARAHVATIPMFHHPRAIPFPLVPPNTAIAAPTTPTTHPTPHSTSYARPTPPHAHANHIPHPTGPKDLIQQMKLESRTLPSAAKAEAAAKIAALEAQIQVSGGRMKGGGGYNEEDEAR